MTDDIKTIQNITKNLGKEIIEIGHIFFKRVDLNDSIGVTKEIKNYIFDEVSHNFHMIPGLKEKERIEEYIKLINSMRQKIINELKEQMNAQILLKKMNMRISRK